MFPHPLCNKHTVLLYELPSKNSHHTAQWNSQLTEITFKDPVPIYDDYDPNDIPPDQGRGDFELKNFKACDLSICHGHQFCALDF